MAQPAGVQTQGGEAVTTQRDLDRAAKRLAELLEATRTPIVFAESCTGGLVSATLTRIPGVSAWLCGSAVVYQLETKHGWLGIPRELLDDPGPVSRDVAAAMAAGVLDRTPQADVAVSVTGHLGPDAPPAQDGLVFVAVAFREGSGSTRLSVNRHTLPAPDGGTGTQIRRHRQQQATLLVLETAAESVRG
jgi:PncC family amidohydrolase